MHISRLVNLVAAIAISGIQWTALLSASSNTQAVREVGASLADGASEGALPVVVVTARHRS